MALIALVMNSAGVTYLPNDVASIMSWPPNA